MTGGGLVVRDLSVAPPGRADPVLARVSFTLPAGSLGVLLGANGTGKSSLLKTLCGLWPARSGSVRLDEEPVLAFDPRRTALLLEDPAAQLTGTTARREAEFALECLGCGGPEAAAAADRVLGRLGLAPLADRPADTLSAGEQAGVLLAAALLAAPSLLLLDDPFLYLDPDSAYAALDVVRGEVAAGRAGSALIAAHDAELAAEADYVGLLGEGSLVAWGPAEDVLRGPLPGGVAPPLALRVDAILDSFGFRTGRGRLTPEAAAERVHAAAAEAG